MIVALLLHKGRIQYAKRHKNGEILDFIDEIVLHMRAGLSIESVLESILRESKWFFLKNALTNGQNSSENEKDIVKLVQFSREHPSQSFKTLNSYRASLRLMQRLTRKQESVTLQARAQAAVSVGIFATLLTIQHFLFPDLAQTSTSLTRGVLIGAFCLLAVGVAVIFRMSRIKEFPL